MALLPAPAPADPSNQSRPTASSDLARATATRANSLEKQGDDFLREVARRLAASPIPAPADLPALQPRNPVTAANHPSLPLPVHAGRASLGWITRSIRENHQRPPANAVRLEEILNHFPLRPAGTTAVTQGITIATETIACPWKPSASLLVISLRGAAANTAEIEAAYHADTTRVLRYRLLGFAPVAGTTPGALPTRLPAGTTTTLAIEIESSPPSGPLGSIHWTVNGTPATPVPLIRQTDAEPSDDARFAALVCTYAQWLASDPNARADADLVAALAREIDSPALPPERADFLELIQQSLDL